MNEVDLDGNVVHLTSLNVPPEVFTYLFMFNLGSSLCVFVNVC